MNNAAAIGASQQHIWRYRYPISIGQDYGWFNGSFVQKLFTQPTGYSIYYYCCSLNGKYHLVIYYNESVSPKFNIYLSNDFGISFNRVFNSYTDSNTAVRCNMSENGQYMTVNAGGSTPGRIYISTDYGANWNQVLPTGVNQAYNWAWVEFSSDGQYQVAYFGWNGTGYPYLSSNYGSTWNAITTLPSTYRQADRCRLLDNGIFYIISNYYQGRFSYSTDYGENWNYRQPKGTTQHVNGVVCSSNGQYIYISYYYTSVNGVGIRKSSDYGENWTDSIPYPANTNAWVRGLSCSSDGRYVFAMVYIDSNGSSAGSYTNNVVYSEDFAVTWKNATTEGRNLPTKYFCY